jgi:two-component system nitrogen regulation response regulator GlnG
MIRQAFQWVMGTHEVEVLTAATVHGGWERIQELLPEVIVLDYQLPDGTGLELFDRINGLSPRPTVIFLTAFGSGDVAMEAMKRGAFDYLEKPFELEEMDLLLKRAFEAARARTGPTSNAFPAEANRIVGRSPLIRDVCKQIGRVAPLEATVLILGESGTGKELIARAIHQHSQRSDKPFVPINCAAIPETLVEAELFGNEPGAYTGAVTRRIGRFEQAQGGTVFLDEIGDMSPAIQAKVLRFLQNRTFERVGGGVQITAQVRVIAATNHDLDKLIAENRFRSDLYFRLKEFAIRAPTLRERFEDIPDLAQYLLLQFAHESGRDVRQIAPEVLDTFRKYPWPGNVRELRGVIVQAAIKTIGHTLLPEFLPTGFGRNAVSGSGFTLDPNRLDVIGEIESMLQSDQKDIYDRILALVESEMVRRTLRHANGHLGQTCELLGIDRKTLRNKLAALGIRPDETSPE